MQNFYFSYSSITFFKRLSLIICLFGGVFFTTNVFSQTVYEAEGSIKVSNPYQQTVLAAGNLAAEGDFMLNNGMLDQINSLKLSTTEQINSNSRNSVNQFKLNVTQTMVLPIMRKVFICAVLTNGVNSYRIDMDFDLNMNSDESISFNGTKTIKSTSFYNFYHQPVFGLTSNSTNNELTLNIDLVFKPVVKPIEVQAELAMARPLICNHSQLSAR